jgi:hypothetical protein
VSVVAPRSNRRRSHRRDRPFVEHGDRRALEQAGWRTLLEYRENHVRSDDGTLLAVHSQWTGEAEFDLGRPAAAGATGASGRRRVLVATATAADPTAVWADLRRQVAHLTQRSERVLA